MHKKNVLPMTVFFVVLIGLIASLFVFQIFFTNQNFSSRPIYGSVVSSGTLTDQQIQDEINYDVFQILFFNALPYYYYPQLALSPLNISSYYFGTVFASDGGYNFAPTVMKDDNGYKMWWCSNNLNKTSQYVFGIYYSTSTNSFYWTPKQLVLEPTTDKKDNLFACQPTVVKVKDTYYMYYAGGEAGVSGDTVNMNSSIFLATSSDGVRWIKYNDNIPQPVISPTYMGQGNFSFVNQPSVLYYNNKFYLYYTNSTSGSGTDIFLATSDDGINFTVQNNVQPVFAPPVGDDRDVKFLNSAGTFFMMYGSIDTNKIFWTNSSDGIHWLAHDDSRNIPTEKHCNFGPAILGYGNGSSDLQSVVYYTAGDTFNSSTPFGCFDPTSWTTDASVINITLSSLGQNFTVSDFKCSNITGGFNCKISYSNTLNESALVLFLLVDSNGDVKSNSVPIATQGNSQTGMLVLCNQLTGDFKISWRVYRQSDVGLTSPILWSSPSQRQSISCPT